jgi:hypothetical protein
MRSFFNFFQNLTGRIESTPLSSGGDRTDVHVEDIVVGSESCINSTDLEQASTSLSPVVVDEVHDVQLPSPLPEFFGKGIFKRPGWSPKSTNSIRKLKYQGLVDYHYFKVWYVNLPDRTFDFRDYEELVDTYPNLLPLCIEAIRKGVRPVSKQRCVISSGSVKSGFPISVLEESTNTRVTIPYQSASAFCVVNSFVGVMAMEEVVREYILIGLPDEESNLRNLDEFLRKEGISLERIKLKGCNKIEWIVSNARVGKYLVSGNGHVVGVNIEDENTSYVIEPACNHRKLLSKRSLADGMHWLGC